MGLERGSGGGVAMGGQELQGRATPGQTPAQSCPGRTRDTQTPGEERSQHPSSARGHFLLLPSHSSWNSRCSVVHQSDVTWPLPCNSNPHPCSPPSGPPPTCGSDHPGHQSLGPPTAPPSQFPKPPPSRLTWGSTCVPSPSPRPHPPSRPLPCPGRPHLPPWQEALPFFLSALPPPLPIAAV